MLQMAGSAGYLQGPPLQVQCDFQHGQHMLGEPFISLGDFTNGIVYRGAVKCKFFGKQAPFGGGWESSGWLALGGESVALFVKREVCSLPRREGGKQGDDLHLNVNSI